VSGRLLALAEDKRPEAKWLIDIRHYAVRYEELFVMRLAFGF
jgi:hypothetical protein